MRICTAALPEILSEREFWEKTPAAILACREGGPRRRPAREPAADLQYCF